MQTIETDAQKWFLACQAEDIPENGGGCIKYGDLQIAVFNFARCGQWYATDNLYPHRQQMRGMTGTQGGEPKVACPFHKKTFSLETGSCLGGGDYRIKTYPVKVEDGRVYIGVGM